MSATIPGLCGTVTHLSSVQKVLFCVGKACGAFALEDALAFCVRHKDERRWAMAYGCRGLTSAIELRVRVEITVSRLASLILMISVGSKVRGTYLCRQLRVDRIARKVQNGPLPANVEDGVVVRGTDVANELARLQKRLYLGVLEEASVRWVLLYAPFVDFRVRTLRRGEVDIVLGFQICIKVEDCCRRKTWTLAAMCTHDSTGGKLQARTSPGS